MMTMGSASLCSGCGTSALDQLGDSVAELRAFFLPVCYAIQLDTHTIGTFWRYRIVKADALDKTPIAAIARIRYHHIKEGTVLGTTACKSNDDHN
jgi:hypothetical protein